MADYKAMYYHLAGQMSGAIESLQAVVAALQKAQQVTEDMYVDDHDDEDEAHAEH